MPATQAPHGTGRTDMDGEQRVMGGRIDMGADEFTARAFVAGDMNCDGQRSPSDIAGFVLSLVDPVTYETAFPNCQALNADMNLNGTVTVGDIARLVEALTCE